MRPVVCVVVIAVSLPFGGMERCSPPTCGRTSGTEPYLRPKRSLSPEREILMAPVRRDTEAMEALPRAPFVGRERELAQLERCLHAVQASRGGSVLLLGDAG